MKRGGQPPSPRTRLRASGHFRHVRPFQPPAAMALKAFAWAVVPVVGLAELAGHFFFSSRPPSLEEWRRVRASVATLRQKNELIVVAPYWAEPNARSAFGDELMPVAQVARADESTYARAIEVSNIGKSAPELDGWTIAEERREGKFRLRAL